MMEKSDKHKLVIDAYNKVKEELSPEVFHMIGVGQRFLKIQEKLPKIPMYGTAQIRAILAKHDKG